MSSRVNGKTRSVPGGLAIGAGISVAITLLSAVGTAKLLSAEILHWEKIGYIIMGTLFIAAYLGAVTAYNRIRHQRLLVCVMSGLVYFALLLSLTTLFFGGQYDAVGICAVLVFWGSFGAGVLGGRTRGGDLRRKKHGRRR